MKMGQKLDHGYHKDIYQVCKIRYECDLSCRNCKHEGRACEQYKLKHNVDRPYGTIKKEGD